MLVTAAKVQPFNADFYVTTATVIPVLFLALVLQDPGWLRARIWLIKQHNGARRRAEASPWWGVAQVGWFVAVVAASGIEIYSVIGEILAILALEHRSATDLQQHAVADATFILATTALLSLVVRVFVTLYSERDGAQSAEVVEERTE